MDLLTKSDLERLSSRDHGGEHVSLFMPTHRFGSAIDADRIRWKNLVSGVENVLAERGMRRPDIQELLAPAWAHEQNQLDRQ
jgi:hypothetical protein